MEDLTFDISIFWSLIEGLFLVAPTAVWWYNLMKGIDKVSSG